MFSLVDEMLDHHKRLAKATDEKTKAVIQKQIADFRISEGIKSTSLTAISPINRTV